jgi:GDP-L-fucose synthase
MKVVVTGGSGLVGTALRQIAPEWLYPPSGELNLLNNLSIVTYFEHHRPDVVIHLAARVGGLYRNLTDNKGMFVDNLMMNLNVITASEQIGVKKFIGILSTCIFPDEIWYPLTENQIHLGPPHHSNEGYAYAKRMMEIHLKMSTMDTICLIPTNLFGPHDNFNIEQAHVIPALIHKCYLAKKENRPFVVAGSGSALRQFLCSGDLAKIIRYFVDEYTTKLPHETFICAPGEDKEVSIEQVAYRIATTMEYEHGLEFDTTQPEGQHRKSASNQHLLFTIGGFEFSDFDVKLVETINWFKAQQP